MARLKKKKHNIESPSLLFNEYDWYKKLFPLALQKSTDDYFLEGLRCELVGVSKNINLLQTKEPYFVTKVKIDKFYEMYLRISQNAMMILLDKGIGKAGRPFNIENVSELEKQVLTGFNDYVSRIIVPLLEPAPVVNFVRTNFDVTHLTFVIRNEEENTSGRLIVSLPDGRLAPQQIESLSDKFTPEDFYECTTEVRISIGKTRFALSDLKNLEAGDLVILEDSNIKEVKLYVNDEEKTVLLEPNLDIELPFNKNNGGEDMAEKSTPKNLWDSIEVDMYAELNPVKITLGNLKKIELGQVVDIAALYDNKVTLRVENKVIGHGELVIVNDRYGVKVSDIIEKTPVISQVVTDKEEGIAVNTETEIDETQSDNVPADSNPEVPVQEGENEGEEEFDYSDFELEDEDI